MTMNLELTAAFVKVSEGYVAFVEELPGAKYPGRHTGGSERESEGGGQPRPGSEPYAR
jgi:hypothetical protein